MDFDLLQNGLLQSLVLAILSYGVMIPFRLVKFADLTAEGAYPLGGVLCATLMLKGYHPLLALFVGSLGAGCLGIATGLIHLWLKVDTLLAGIIVSTMVYSVNLNMMGKPNVALFKAYGLFQSEALVAPIIFLSFCCLAIFLFFK
jgi:putative ABC transport system permease protein